MNCTSRHFLKKAPSTVDCIHQKRSQSKHVIALLNLWLKKDCASTLILTVKMCSCHRHRPQIQWRPRSSPKLWTCCIRGLAFLSELGCISSPYSVLYFTNNTTILSGFNFRMFSFSSLLLNWTSYQLLTWSLLEGARELSVKLLNLLNLYAVPLTDKMAKHASDTQLSSCRWFPPVVSCSCWIGCVWDWIL